MARHSFLASALTLACALAAAPAAAQDSGGTEEDPEPELSDQAPEATPTEANPYDRLLAASVTGGLDTPFGIGGLALEVTPFRYLAVYAGGGVGRDGVRVAAGLRPQFPMGQGALGLMLGVTGGPLDWDSGAHEEARVHRYWEFALFVHGGVTAEYRWDEGFFGRLAVGFEALVTPEDATVCAQANGNSCTEGSEALFTPVRGWVGLSVGYAFAL